MQHSTICTQSASRLQLHQRYKFKKKKKLSLYICTSSRYTTAILCSSVIYMLHLFILFIHLFNITVMLQQINEP